MLGLELSLLAEGDVKVIIPMTECFNDHTIRRIWNDIDSLQLPPEDIGSLILVVDNYMEIFLGYALQLP